MQDFNINSILYLRKNIYFTNVFEMKWNDKIEIKDNSKTIKYTVYNYLQQVGVVLDE